MVIKGSLGKGFCFAAAAADDDDGAFLFSELNTNKRFCLHPVRTQFTWICQDPGLSLRSGSKCPN